MLFAPPHARRDRLDCNANGVPDELDVAPALEFPAPRRFAVGVGFAPVAVIAADLDGDGVLDIATANGGAIPSGVSVLLGVGDGTER